MPQCSRSKKSVDPSISFSVSHASNLKLPPHLHTQHGTPEPIPQTALLIPLAFLAHMRRRPLLGAVRIIVVVQIPLALTVVRRVDGLAVLAARIGAAAMRQVAAEDEQLARRQLDGPPALLRHPLRLDAVVGRGDRDGHGVAAVDDLEAAVAHSGRVDGEQDRQVLDLLDVRIGGRVDVRGEAAAAGEFVVDLLFEQAHGLLRELVQDADDFGPAQKGAEAGVGVCKVLGAAEDALAAGVDFLIRHPWHGLGPRQVVDLLGPALQGGGLGGGEDIAENQVAVLGEGGMLVCG